MILKLKSMETLSPYRIKWVVIDSYTSRLFKYQEKRLSKIGFKVIRIDKRGVAVKHYGSDEAVINDAQNIKSAWQILNANGHGAVITDKQFGMADSFHVESFIQQATAKQIEKFHQIING